MKQSIAVILFFTFLLMISCSEETSPPAPELPPTPVLTSESVWGVANLPYLKILETMDSAADVNGLLRKGDVVRVISKIGTEDGRTYWCEVESHEAVGWVLESDIDIYETEAQALTAGSMMDSGGEG